ncbi:hypothetical protein COU74_01445 [Candidatus Peregrinibacteria bacterium CG10_big_fil_rev_8_21_14_0_10_36_19]|nr:MAG: hypothetical protein COU74_01445 [Candidatus Peregrinibacteria bacterium CG10_big_fil_rev_8_21_14_0_10_36_19]
MAKKKFHNSIKFVELEDLKNNRFSFVQNEILRENIAIKMQYIVFLVSLEEEYELPGAVTYSTFKTVIIFTASIIEALVNYKIHELIEEGKVDETKIMGKDAKLSIVKEFQKISATEEICGIKRTTKPKKLSERMDFQELNRAAKRSGLFTEAIFKKAEKIRETRNRIHPYGLKEVDDKYSKDEINNIFSMASSIIERVEKY